MRHLGDITKINGAEIEFVDIITFGAPCQDLSVAGKRAGMKHEGQGDEETTRSGLFYEAVRVIEEMRQHDRQLGRTGELIRPRYAVYENVPGAFSSNKGADFAAVLTSLVRIVEPEAPEIPVPDNGWPYADAIYGVGADGQPFSVAWALHDAQFYGVPQRRKRLCVLADFAGLTAPWILFDPQLERTTEDGEPVKIERYSSTGPGRKVQAESESLPGNSEPGTKARKGSSAGTESGSGSTGGCISILGKQQSLNCQDDLAGSLSANDYKEPQAVCTSADERAGKCLNNWDVQSKHIQPTNGLAEALYAGECRYGGGESYLLDDKTPTSYTLKIRGGVEIDSAGKRAGKGPLVQTEKCGTIGVSQDQTLIQAYSIQGNTIDRNVHQNGLGIQHQVAHTIDTVDRHGVYCSSGEVAGTLDASYYKGCGERQGVERDVVIQPIAFSQNQREEVRDLNDISGSVSAETGTHQQTFVAYGVTAKGNGDAFISKDRHTTISSGGGMPGKSYPCAMTVSFEDSENCWNEEVRSAGFSFGQSAKARSLGYEREKSPTIRGGEGGNQKPVVLAVDCRNGTESSAVNGTLQAKPNGGHSLNCNIVVRTEE